MEGGSRSSERNSTVLLLNHGVTSVTPVPLFGYVRSPSSSKSSEVHPRWELQLAQALCRLHRHTLT